MIAAGAGASILVTDTLLGATAAASAAILAALLVVTSLLQLSSRATGENAFSLAAEMMWTRSRVVLVLVEVLAYVSGASVLLNLVAMALSSRPLDLVAFALGLVDVILFSVISVLAVHWFARNQPD